MDSHLERRARAWLAEDPDPDTRAELSALLDAGDVAGLRSRFDGRLQFGTAGLRGPLGAGPLRMNRVIVRRAAAGLVDYLLSTSPSVAGASGAGVVVGYDARHKSDVFALDTARVLAAAGITARLMPCPLPTPLLAFAVRYTGAAAGVMVTASHNPPADNGYKVYLPDGSQIVPPIDGEISACIDSVPAGDVPLAAEDDPRIETIDVRAAYLDAVAAVPFLPGTRDVRVAYSALHGVGRDLLLAAFARAGFDPPVVVARQGDPDPDFPTVSFPNPEEPGAMDLLVALAAQTGADVAIANDPDADRLAVAVPDSASPTGWRQLSGNEVGWLLADHVLANTSGDDRLVVTTVVSSRLLSRLAAAYGVHYAETLTGFKWIAKEIRDRVGQRFVFGYEEALGYLVDDVVRDKDGISAALVMAEIAALAKSDGVTLLDRLDQIAARVGRYRTAQWSLRTGAATIHAVLARLHEEPPHALGPFRVERVDERPEASLVMLSLGGDDRVLVRPSGTEPKVKFYFEVVDRDPQEVVDAMRAWVARTPALLDDHHSPN
ncbi:MAG: phospho-sugar mutase [Acidimicrobiia bacterium]